MCSRQLSVKEQKLKEEFGKCGLEEMCIETATLSTTEQLFVVTKPALYKIKNTNSYLLFGDPVDYASMIRHLQESSKDPEILKKMAGEEESVIDGEAGEVVEEAVEEEGEVDEQNINIVMEEGKVPRDVAVKALKEAGNDLIQALVNLSKNG